MSQTETNIVAEQAATIRKLQARLQRLEDIEAEFLAVAHEQLPIHADVREVILIEKRDGRWHTRLVFPLAKATDP